MFTVSCHLCWGFVSSFLIYNSITFNFVVISRTKMASSHGDHTVRVVDCKTFKCVRTLKGHPRTPWCITFHPSSDQLLASGCLGGQVRVWNLEVNLFTLHFIHSLHAWVVATKMLSRLITSPTTSSGLCISKVTLSLCFLVEVWQDISFRLSVK